MKISKGLWVFLLGVTFGCAGETLLFLRTQSARIDRLLTEDFRILAFLTSDPGESRARVVEERIRALPGVQEAAYVSPEEALDSLQSWDPELAQSVALMGENPLHPAFEIQVDADVLSRLESWQASISTLPEIEEVRYKPLQARAILQARFYVRFLDLGLSLGALTWLLGSALGLWGLLAAQRSRNPAPGTRRPEGPMASTLAPQGAWAIGGAVAGMSAVALAALPLRAWAPLWAWPSWGAQLLLALAGGLGAGLLPEWRGAPPARWQRHPAQEETPDPMHDLVAGP